MRNAEYRLCLERNLDNDERTEKRKIKIVEVDSHEKIVDRTKMMFNFSLENNLLPNLEKNEEQPKCENMGIEGLGEMTLEAQEYILHLQSRLKSVKKV